MLDKKLSKYAPWSVLSLRLGVGIVFSLFAMSLVIAQMVENERNQTPSEDS